MSDPQRKLADLVVVDAGFKPAVHLPDDFDQDGQNAQLIQTYIPTSQSMNFLAEVARSLNPASNERARMLIGTFGTGKSDLLLMLCNYFSRSVDDPIIRPFYEKLQRINEAQYKTIYEQREHRKPFLVVLLQANAVTPFPGFILHGLEQSLRRAGLEELMLPTRYAAAIQKIEEWQREGHVVLKTFMSALRDNEAKELSTLLKELDSPNADLAFPAFLRAFRTATGTAFDIYSYNRPEHTYKRVAQSLRERGSHSGILVVVDEFTEVLRRLARSGDQQAAEVDAEALGVQDLANTSISSGQNQLHFVIASLESFASSAAESTSGSSSKIVEKFGGRFKSFELDLQDSAELIRGAIRRLDQRVAVLPNRQRDELVDFCRTLPLWGQKGKPWTSEKVVDGCFPLHPLVTYALPLINGRVAQHNRTMFLFLKDQGGLGGFLSQYQLASHYPDWSNLLTLDRLFDYFEKSIQVRRSDITDAYNHSFQLLERAKVDTALAHRTLKVVALCEVIEPSLSPTRQLLRQALNLPPSAEEELVTALALLEQLEALYPPSDAEGEALGAYSLPMAGRVSSVNLRQRVIRKARELHNSVGRLQTTHPPEPIKAEEYNRRRGSARELKAKYISMIELSSAARLKEDLDGARDGLLWYVIASSEADRSDAQSRARELTRQHPRLVVAVPIVPLNILDLLKNYEALEIIRGDNTLDSSARAYLQDSGLVGKGFAAALKAAIDKLREEKQWEWFREGAGQPNCANRAQVQDLASRVMTAVYPNTPEHQLAQHFKPEGYTPTLNRALVAVLKQELRLSKSGSAGESVIIRIGMAGLGLAKSVRTEGAFEIFALTEPTGSQYHSQKIWQLFQTHLSAKRPWSKLIETLRKDPYGLYDSLLMTFTVAFCTLYADSIEIVQINGQPSVLDESVLKGLIDKPQNYNVRLQPLTEPEKQWLRGVVSAGLRRSPDGGAQGKTLRARVAAQTRVWLSGLRLPLFAEKLDAHWLATLQPDTAEPIIAASVVVLQNARSDEAIATALLNEIPGALGASDHSTWTSESVDGLLIAWSEVCRLLERLPERLEQHVTRAVTAVFGCMSESTGDCWGHIYRWRMNRKIVQSQITSLGGYTSTVFRLSGQPTSTVRESFLEEFSRTIIGINTAYQNWPTIDHLDRLVKEIQKAYDDIEARWRAVANAEDVWHDGLASAALGRPMSGVNADSAATYLRGWAASITWPACAPHLQPADLQQLYPTLGSSGWVDVSAILRRTQHQVEDWRRELGDALPRQFGVEGWTKAEVERGVARLSDALKHAANLDTLIRKHVLSTTLQLFTVEGGSSGTPSAILKQWRDVHPIPPENDLDAPAKVVLGQIDNSADAETTLLMTMPRALSEAGQSYQQWRSYADLEKYVAAVASAVQTINSYTPLTTAETQWLTGIVTETLHRPFTQPPREKYRLCVAVSIQISNWLREQYVPSFAATLAVADLQQLFPQAESVEISTARTLLNADDQLRAAPDQFLLVELPQIIGGGSEGASLKETEVSELLATLALACRYIHDLNEVITQRLIGEIAPAFGIDIDGEGAGTLVAKLRTWRQSYILFAHEGLSADAALVSEALAAPTDDPLKLLLTTLPAKLREVRAPYGIWRSWDQRTTYVHALRVAAQEIAERGRVEAATPRVQGFWQQFKAQIADLTQDEQRWLIKAFSEEFRA